jgi:type IV pilus assembly protein PilC
MRSRDLISFCRRMGTSLEAGIDLRKCWLREAERARGSDRQVMSSIAQQLGAGRNMSDAMSATEDYFPKLVRDLVQIGELSGNSDKIFAGLADHYGRLQELKRSYLRGITWPMIQLSMALVVVGLFILVTGLIQANQADAPDMLGLGLVGVSGFIKYVAFLVLVGFLIAFLIGGWRRGKLGAGLLMKFLMRVPYLGECLQHFALARMSWTLALVSQTSMDVRQAIGLSMAGTNNAYYTPHEQRIRDVISQGRPIHEALREVDVFPTEFVNAIEAGETAGKLNETLEYLSREYQARAVMMSDTLTKLAAFATWAVVAIIIIFFILRVFSVYLDAINSAGAF